MENSIEEDITKIDTYIELVLEKDYCNCNELNTILGKHCDGSKNVAYAMQHILSELEKKDKEYEELTEASKELCKTVNLMKKVINEMAEYIIDLIKYNNSEEERDKEEIKEYFTKKAEKGE